MAGPAGLHSDRRALFRETLEGPVSVPFGQSLRSSAPALLLTLILGTACADSLAPDVTINRVTLTPVTASVGVGSTQQLTATARNRKSDPIPDIPFTFESLQPAIATVDGNGLVTAVGAGVATMRATTGTFVATSTITVTIPVCSNAAVTSTINSPQVINTTLTSNDCLFTGVGNSDGYRFVAAAPTTVLFTLTGATIRPKLTLTGSLTTTIIAESWSSTLGDTARLIATVAAGTYTLWVLSSTADYGPYVLKAESAVPCTAALATTPIALGQTVNGALTATSCFLPNNAEGMGWSLNLAVETPVRFDVGTNGFLPRVVITDATLGIYSASIAVGTDSAVLNDLIPAGNYSVWVTTEEGGQGTFTLARSTATFTYCEAPGDTISVPGSIAGSLSLDDCVLEPGFASDPIFMEVLAPTTLRIDLTSTAFDAFLAVADSTDTIIVTDDDGGLATNSRILGNFSAGRYTILPQAYGPNSSGAYTLSVSLAAGINQGNIRLTPKPRTRVRGWPAPADVPAPR